MNKNLSLSMNELLVSKALLQCEDSTSILEVIYNVYFENQGRPDGILRKHYQELDSMSEQLPDELKEAIHSIVADLCTEYERKGFIDGLKTGAHLIQELNK